ncbi:MAG: hypothetical protein FWE40_02945 [Oscillospiraceae bacterium]|nr:hypothetical protein [Oscillospiraceae bacterium]
MENKNTHWVDKLTDALQSKLESANALLFDLSDKENHQQLKEKLESDNALILFNANEPEMLSQTLGFGLSAACVVIKPYPNFYAVHAFGIAQEEGAARENQDTQGNQCACVNKDDKPQVMFEELSASKQACRIADVLDCDHACLYQSNLVENSTLGSLPLHQYKLIYLAIEHTRNLTDSQVTVNSVVMEISLIASYNPQYKYLRIRSLGAGCSPGQLQANDTYDRGYFQSAVNMQMLPKTNKLTTLSTDPKNINKQTTYTTGSSFSVGVDISKNPSFSPSYTVSESTTTQISDFNIYNNGAGLNASWDFRLSMAEKDIWDMFSHSFMRKARVKELPALATRNLQPVTEAVWYGSNTLTDTIGIDLGLRLDHYRCWVTGSWDGYQTHYSHKWVTVGQFPFYLDFGAVYA